MTKLMKSVDVFCEVHQGSGKHDSVSADKDIILLANQYKAHKLFTFQKGRSHEAYPTFASNLLDNGNYPKIKKWIKDKLQYFFQSSVYTQFN